MDNNLVNEILSESSKIDSLTNYKFGKTLGSGTFGKVK